MASVKVEKAPISTEDVKHPQIVTKVTIRNSTLSPMTRTRYHSWLGDGFFPITIEAGGLIKFDHLRGTHDRSKGYVVYAGRNKDNYNCSWILAWDTPADTNIGKNKIFMLCGLTSYIDTITAARIREDMERSNTSDYDTISQYPAWTKAVGKVVHMTPNIASLEAEFGLRPS